MKAIRYAKNCTIISAREEDIILHCRWNILVGQERSIWQKVENQNFDVAMGSIDSAEVCECVDLLLLMRLEKVLDKDSMGLYRDDGLWVVRGSGPEVERIKKKIIKIFQEEKLKVTIDPSTKIVEFLDVVMDLTSGTHKPFTKPNLRTKYVSMMSSHPPNILRSIP